MTKKLILMLFLFTGVALAGDPKPITLTTEQKFTIRDLQYQQSQLQLQMAYLREQYQQLQAKAQAVDTSLKATKDKICEEHKAKCDEYAWDDSALTLAPKPKEGK